jgi:hypothetical protein
MVARTVLAGLVVALSFLTTAAGLAIFFHKAATARLASWLERSARHWPAWLRNDHGAYSQRALRFWGLGLVSVGLLFPMLAFSYLVDNAKAGAMHAILFIPLLLLIITWVGVGASSRAYLRSNPRIPVYNGQPVALLVAVVIFGLFAGVAYLATVFGFE